MVLTGSFVLSSAIGLDCHRRQRDYSRRLDAGVEASGPHDFSVRVGASRQKRRRVHRIPPRVRDDRERPSRERDGETHTPDLGLREAEFPKFGNYLPTPLYYLL
jgi:hypothetical protein